MGTASAAEKRRLRVLPNAVCDYDWFDRGSDCDDRVTRRSLV